MGHLGVQRMRRVLVEHLVRVWLGVRARLRARARARDRDRDRDRDRVPVEDQERDSGNEGDAARRQAVRAALAARVVVVDKVGEKPDERRRAKRPDQAHRLRRPPLQDDDLLRPARRLPVSEEDDQREDEAAGKPDAEADAKRLVARLLRIATGLQLVIIVWPAALRSWIEAAGVPAVGVVALAARLGVGCPATIAAEGWLRSRHRQPSLWEQ